MTSLTHLATNRSAPNSTNKGNRGPNSGMKPGYGGGTPNRGPAMGGPGTPNAGGTPQHTRTGDSAGDMGTA
jgi:hypothetical protein